jgi:hypothetical protein
MGWEKKCIAVIDGSEVEGRLQLETDRLYFRSPTAKLNAALKDATIKASDGVLIVTVGKKQYEFELGAAANKWVHRIHNPKSLVEKLGLRENTDVIAVGKQYEVIIDELSKGGITLSTRKHESSHDWIFVGVENSDDLKLLAGLSSFIKSNGGIWVIFPKGLPDLKAENVIAAGKASGLVDTKIARVSERLTAMKFVIPVKYRKRT